MNIRTKISIAAVAALTLSPLAGPLTAAEAAGRDSDGDGMPNRWEKRHGLDPNRAADARQDLDGDGLVNLREYRVGSAIRDEDTDADGHDDGDEVDDRVRRTDVRDRDTDDDGTLDGDEDSDRDTIDNEDEDDAREVCARDDDDDDGDAVDDEDENELGLDAGSADSDEDGVEDGDEDPDEDGETHEDADDDEDDRCDGDQDGDGEADEDEDDVLGVIETFDATTGVLTITTTAGWTFIGLVTGDTEIEVEGRYDEGDDEGDDDETGGGWLTVRTAGDQDGEDEGSTADLQPGVRVAEVEVDDETGVLDEVEVYSPAP